MASALKGTGKKLGGAFVQIRAALGPLRAGLATARSMVSASVRGITKLAAIPITISIKAVRSAMSAAVNIVKGAMRRIRQLMLISGIGGGAFLWGFAQFERAMRKATAVSETTAEQFKQMSEMARAQAVRLNKSASELAQGFYFLGSAGLSAIDQIAAFPAVATLAKAAVIDMGSAAEMVVDTMKGFGIAFQNTTHVTDVMAKAVVSSNMTFAQLGTALSYVSGVSRMANNTLEETTAAIAQMADVGIKGSRAGVYMRTGLLRLMAPMSSARKEMEKYGVSMYDAEGKMKPFVQIVGELSDALRSATEEQRNMAFKALFGQRAITGQIAIFRQGRAELERFTDMLRGAGGTAEEIARKQLNSLAEQFGRLIKIVTDTAYAIGKALGPALREMVSDLQGKFKQLNEFFKEHELAIAKYALLGYRYFKAFGAGVIDIVRDISQNWDERWAFMVKVVKIQVQAARDIIATTFDDVWATLKDGAVAYGKTLYEVFKKVFTDIARNMKGWIAGGLSEWKEYNKIYAKFLDEQQRMFEREGIRTHKPGGYETEEYKAAKRRAAEYARKEFRERKKLGEYKGLWPEKIEGEPWADVGKRIKEHWIEPYEKAKERLGGILDDIVEIEKKAAAEIGAAVPEAWKNRWAQFKTDIMKIGAEVDQWYEEQKKAAQDATAEIEKVVRARDQAAGGLAGKATTEAKEEKVVSFVGLKEAWQQMVRNLYSPQTKLLSEQADLLGEIDTGQEDIVDAVRDVEAAVKDAFAGKAPEKQPPTKWQTHQERQQEKWAAYLERKLFGRKRLRIEKEAPKKPVPPKLKPKEYEPPPKWPKATTVDIKPVEVVMPEPGPVKIDTPEIKVPQVEAPEIESPVVRIEAPEIKVEKPGLLAVDVPDVAVKEIQAPALDKLEVDSPEIKAPQIGPIQIEKSGPLAVEAPQISPVAVEKPEIGSVGVDIPPVAPIGVEAPKMPGLNVEVPKIEISKPEITAPQIDAPEITAPEMGPVQVEKPDSLAIEAPKVGLVGVDIPKLAPLDVQMPKLPALGVDAPKIPPVGFDAPKIPPVGFDAPKVGVPELPPLHIEPIQIDAPKIEVPTLEVEHIDSPKLTAPDITIPKIEVPAIETPKIEVPDMTAPELAAPKIKIPIPEIPKLGPLDVAAPDLGVDMPRIDVPKVDVPKIEPLRVEINTPKIDVPKIDAPIIKGPEIEACRLEIPRPEMPKPSLPIVPAEKQIAPRTDQTLLKEARTVIDELRRIRTGINKLAPIGATAP